MDRETILAADDLPRKKVFVPQWKDHVWVRGLTGTELDSFEDSLLVQEGKKVKRDRTNFRARIVVRGLVNEQGERLLQDDDAAAIGKKNAGAVDLLFGEIQALSGMTDAAMAEIEKNSVGVPSDSSSSA